MQQFRSGAVNTVLASRAPSTSTVYSQAFREFQLFAIAHKVSCLPAQPEHVLMFLEARRAQGLSSTSLSNSLYGIAWMHNLMGFPSPSDHTLCRAFLEGARRLAPPKQCKTIPATHCMLVALHNAALQSGRLIDYRTFLIALFSYAGCLRFAECSTLTFADITIHDKGIQLYLKQSKTDQHKLGNVVELADTNTPLSPKSCFSSYLGLLGPGHSKPHSFVFANIGSPRPVSRDNCVKLLRALLKDDPSPHTQLLTMHSFRIGCATALLAKGLDSAHVRQLGRWRSDTSLDRYNRQSSALKLDISRLLDL